MERTACCCLFQVVAILVCSDRGPAPTEMLSDQFLSIYLVPFLAISFVLLAAAIGAIVLARKD